MFKLRDVLAERKRIAGWPPGYNVSMGVVVFCGRRPASITRVRTAPCPTSFIVHFKSLLLIDAAINRFIDTQFIAMQRLFAESDVAAVRGTTEDLSGHPDLQSLVALEVGPCKRGWSTDEQIDLFANRNNAKANDIVVYIVGSMLNAGGGTNILGCSAHPRGKPGLAVVQTSSAWTVAHEVGHVLGLEHVDKAIPANSDFLMWPFNFWTNLPPDIRSDQRRIMIDSDLMNVCE
jgi:Metallo-peptidase family M12B Reprolysin-like